MKNIVAVFLVLLISTMPLAGCIGDDDANDSASETPAEELIDWQVHFAQSASDLPTCDENTAGRLYFVEADSNFQVCKSSGWVIIDITGPPGRDGIDGQDGANGQKGESVLMRVTTSGDCPSGGNTFHIGTDVNRDNVLSNDEVSTTVDVCNGAQGLGGLDGTDGDNGLDGIDGTNGLNALVTTTTESSGPNCANGGIRIDIGTDDDGSGALEETEIDTTQYVCNGSNGADGQNGADGSDGSSSSSTMLTNIIPPSSSLECDAGGRGVQQGLDNGDNGGIALNGIMEPGEVDYITTFCSSYMVWELTDLNHASSTPGHAMSLLVGDTIYFDAMDSTSGRELWAHDSSNHSTWRVTNIDPSGSSSPGENMAVLVDDTIYFDADDGITGVELWAHDTSNHSTWRVADLSTADSDPGLHMSLVVKDTIYFSANDFSLATSSDADHELWAYDTSNRSVWRVADVNNGSQGSQPGRYMAILASNDTFYFDANDGASGVELWAHNTSNASTWQVADINPGSSYSKPGEWLEVFVHDTIYFSADDGVSGSELWAHSITNLTTWLVAETYPGSLEGAPGYKMQIVVNDTIYFDAYEGSTGRELWAHSTTNQTTWRITDLNSGNWVSNPGYHMAVASGNIIYFGAHDGLTGYELWAHDTANHSTWRLSDINSGFGNSNPGYYNLQVVVDDVLYFDATDGSFDGTQVYAIHTRTHSISQVTTLFTQCNGGPGYKITSVFGDTIFFDAGTSCESQEVWAMTIQHSIHYD
ncbi:MAG: hypothetical protein CMA56_00045 [Euryarchaeota archaeon]|nr:hypothetical protein [Euryarchaeota archaeon]